VSDFEFIKTEIPGCLRIQRKVHTDVRGVFIKFFQSDHFKEVGFIDPPQEIFFSESNQGVIRGMHFQAPPSDQTKVVACIHGTICDVVLDLRKNSPTFHKVFSLNLASTPKNSIFEYLIIPRGCAHGFSVPNGNATVVYFTETQYDAKQDQGIRYDSIGFNWNIQNPILSERDLSHPQLKNYESPFL